MIEADGTAPERDGSRPCPFCRGTGTRWERSCPKCAGTGHVPVIVWPPGLGPPTDSGA